MRIIYEPQLQFGQVAIEDIEFDLRSRDEIPKLLIGLQQIYCNTEVRNKVFEVLKTMIPGNIDPKNGRPGMPLWKILVLGTLRLICNWDYDKVTDIANQHKKVREMLCHPIDDNSYYPLQTIKDNISLFTHEVLDELNRIVVEYGHDLAGKKVGEKLYGSCDSFPVETNVHFPTDINLLFDALRKIITLIARLCGQANLKGWRKSQYHLNEAKKLFIKAQRMKHSSSKNKDKRAERKELIKQAHLEYIQYARAIVDKANETINLIPDHDIVAFAQAESIRVFIRHAERQIDQIRRRVIEGESIAHHEKVFSIFEEHTKWIKKGKAGVSQELGLNVCIVKDQYGFILHHRVMEDETDNKVAVPIILETIERFPDFAGCSFDKGFHSPENQKVLSTILDRLILPRKGKLSKEAQQIESSPEFKEGRRKHSAVESSIAALENHGLDRCPDHGIHGFKRYVALSILARNIQIIGHMVQEKECKRRKRLKEKLTLAA